MLFGTDFDFQNSSRILNILIKKNIMFYDFYFSKTFT